MKTHIQKLFALVMALSLCLGLLVFPASASGDQVTSTGTIWSAYANSRWSGLFGQEIIGTIFGSACPTSPDALHHGKIIDRNPNGNNWIAKCSYCSDTFPVYDDDMQDAYNGYVGDMQNELGTTQVGSNGYIIPLTPTQTDFSSRFTEYSNATYPQFSSFTFLMDGSSSGALSLFKDSFINIKIPSSGYISYLFDCFCSDSRYSHTNFNVYVDSRNKIPLYPSHYPVSSSTTFRFTGFDVRFNGWTPDYYVTYQYRFALFYEPLSWDVNDFTVNIGGIDSRVGNLSGDYGIIGDNGTIVKSDTQYIMNEITNTYTNPATGTTSPVTNWNYDYSDRSYNLTLESGDTVTVTYGDEHVTIKEGDTTYNVYYIVENPGGGEVDSTPPPTVPPTEHTHDYVSVVTQEPTCISPGIQTNTCSICGDTYPEKIPATGHTWALDRTVNTTYDENGNVLTQGYTIYRCSVCGNEYKDESGSGPPDSGGSGGGTGGGILDKLGELLGTIFNGILTVLGSVVETILDGLISLVTNVANKLGEVVTALLSILDELPKMLEGFSGFLGAALSFLPPEITTILTFGVLALVLVGVLKLFLK